MRRSTLRFFALVVLAILGAPMAMHVVFHDLHQDHHDDGGGQFYTSGSAHGDHEHPIISPGAPPAPARSTSTQASVEFRTATSVTLSSCVAGNRNIIAFGALRFDNDIGPQSVLSTFLI